MRVAETIAAAVLDKVLKRHPDLKLLLMHGQLPLDVNRQVGSWKKRIVEHLPHAKVMAPRLAA